MDGLIMALFLYFLWSCIFIERHYCAAPLSSDSEGLMKMTYDYSVENNPLFLARPDWLHIATCLSAYALGSGYLIMFITFFFKITALRGLCLLIIGFKLYAIIIYYYFQFNGPLKTPNVLGFLAADGPYLLGLFLVISRLLFSSDPFGKSCQKQKPN